MAAPSSKHGSFYDGPDAVSMLQCHKSGMSAIHLCRSYMYCHCQSANMYHLRASQASSKNTCHDAWDAITANSACFVRADHSILSTNTRTVLAGCQINVQDHCRLAAFCVISQKCELQKQKTWKHHVAVTMPFDQTNHHL